MKKLLTVCIFSGFFNMVFAQADTSRWKVEFLSINSLSDDYSPAFFRNGLIFTSNRNPGFAIKRVDADKGAPFTSLYIVDSSSHIKVIDPIIYYQDFDSIKAPDYTALTSNDSKTLAQNSIHQQYDKLAEQSIKLSDVRLADEFLQSKYHDGPAVYSSLTNDVYITRNNYHKGVSKKGANKKNNLQICIIKSSGGESFYIRKFKHNSNDFSNMHPTLSADEKIMIFASDRPGGFGGTDLYYSLKIDNSWSEPKNMGAKINTAQDEVFPFITSEGNLYFSSSGHLSKGKLDIFFIKLKNEEVVSDPEQLPFPINTEHDDFGFIISGENGYMSSDRLGTDDIFKVTKKF